jgi:prepilin signal peptidase PulO-like enzyme (type II secretory pathway)
MLSVVAIICMIVAVIMLFTLSLSDMKAKQFPFEMVFGLGTLGLLFHLTILEQLVSILESLLGGFIGLSVVILVCLVTKHLHWETGLRTAHANLMCAAGVWLGPNLLILAMMTG